MTTPKLQKEVQVYKEIYHHDGFGQHVEEVSMPAISQACTSKSHLLTFPVKAMPSLSLSFACMDADLAATSDLRDGREGWRQHVGGGQQCGTFRSHFCP
jgi:hypothetical protein